MKNETRDYNGHLVNWLGEVIYDESCAVCQKEKINNVRVPENSHDR